MRKPPVLLAVLLALLSACVTSTNLVPSGGMERGSASAAGAALTVYNAPWEGNPVDLADYVTPIPVEFFNGSPFPVRVSYGDLLLVDETGRRYAAINPFPPDEPVSENGLALGGVLVAGRSRGGGGAHVGAPMGGVVRRSNSANGARVVRGSVVIPQGAGAGVVIGGGLHGYSPYPVYRSWLGAGIDYWGAPFVPGLGYASWVWMWSPVYYPSSSPPSDVLALGIPEGVLAPGGRVSGYLYFQNATRGAHSYQLTWSVFDAMSGAELGRAPVALSLER